MKSNRSKPFSGKQKKEQLQLKKLKKQATKPEVEESKNNNTAQIPAKTRTKIK